MNIFGVGLPEIAVIGAIALVVFGPKRLPELGRTLGKTLRGFQTASNEFEKEIQKAMAEPEKKEISSEDSSKTSQNISKDETATNQQIQKNPQS